MKYALFFVFFSLLVSVGGCLLPSILSTHEQQLGDSYNNSGNYDDALIHYNKYLEVSKTLGSLRNLQSEAVVCRKIAYLHSLKGRYTESLNYLIKSSKLDSLDNNQMELIEDCRDIGKLYSFIGNYFVAIQYLNSALELNKGMENANKTIKLQSVADTYLALSKTNLSIGNYSASLQNILKSIELYNKTNDKNGLSEAYLQYAYLLIDDNEAEKALKIIEQSKMLAKEMQADTTMQLFLGSEALIKIGQYEKALKFKNQALESAEKKNIIPQIVWFCISIGDLYSTIGFKEMATKSYNKALENSRKMDKSILDQSLSYRMGEFSKAETGFKQFGSKSGVAATLLRMGESKLADNQKDAAALLFESSASAYSQMNYKDGLARSYIFLASIYLGPDTKKAKKYLDSALVISKYPDNLWRIFNLTGACYELINKNDSAIQTYKKAVDIIEDIRSSFSVSDLKSNYFSNKTEVYERLISCLYDINNFEEALYYAERAKSRSLLDLLVNKKIKYKNQNDSILIIKEQEYRKKIQQLNKTINSENQPDTIINRSIQNSMNEELNIAQREYSDILLKLELQNPEYKKLVSISSPKAKEIQKYLTDSDAVIEFFVAKNKLNAWIIKKSKIISLSYPISIGLVNDEIKKFQFNIEKSRSDQSKSLDKIYTSVFKPIDAELKDVKEICILPHRSLHFIPFQALKDSLGKYLIEKYSINYAPSYSILLSCLVKNNNSSHNLLGMALGNYPSKYPPLPGTSRELNEIKPLFADNLTMIGDLANKTLFKQNVSKYEILHIATHGLFNAENPLASALIFPQDANDDGHLSVSEIFDMQLKSNLVTLSACKTGLGNIDSGDELVGLSRAFMYAGTPLVIVSLWSVDDNATATIMTKFYRYFISGLTASKSMQMAQLDYLRDTQKAQAENTNNKKTSQTNAKKAFTLLDIDNKTKPSRQDPYYWSPFVLIGNGNIKY